MKHSGFSGLIGVSREDITPPVGIYCRNWGAARTDVAEGVHRPLTLTALTLQDSAEESPLVLIAADLGGWWSDMQFEQECRRQWLAELALDDGRFMFSVTHTHAAPPLISAPRPEYEGGDLVAPYVASFRKATTRAARQALAAAQPAVLEWHTGRCTLAGNRDRPDGDRVVCGYNEAVPADDTLLVGRVTGADGEILATIVNYACHPTTLAWDNQLISPDFVGAMRETIEDQTGGAPSIFLQGASGDLGPRHGFVGDTEVADANGRQLGFAALTALEAMEPAGQESVYDGVVESGAPLAIWKRQPCELPTRLQAIRETVDLPLKDWPGAAELEAELAASTDRVLSERVRRKLLIRQGLGDDAVFALEYWVWQIGDAIVVGALPECYSMLQQQLRAEFPDRAVICIGLVNGTIGYLPPAELYDQDIYQVWQTPFDRGGLGTFIAAAKDSAHDLIT